MKKIAHWFEIARPAVSNDYDAHRQARTDRTLSCQWERDPATGRVFCHWLDTQATIASLCALR